MAGFSSMDAVINALSTNNKGQRLEIQKLIASTNVANIWHTLWTASGIPGVGAYPTAGVGNRALLTKSTVGALPYNNPTSPATLHALSAGASSQTAAGILLLVDRIVHVRITNAQATASFSPVLDATSRLASGEGGLLVVEVASALSAAGNVRNFTYTNEAGTGSRVTQNFTAVASSIVGRVPYASGLFLPLQDGDGGVRSVESTTLVSGAATGELVLSIVRPLALIPVPNTSMWFDRDLILELPSLARIYDDSCISAFFLSATASASFVWNAVLRVAEN